ncbi:MAG: guanylate kinase [Candidatus Buchananbacteria bacterium]|nr:guanylate kinase [Candidatus Buchananbacteria bacterium]
MTKKSNSAKPIQKNNQLFIISGPSGAGEDSVIEALQKEIEFNRVVTTVTREIRPGEKEGKPYHFISVEKFKKMIENDEFVEWAIVYDNYRGCTKKEITRLEKLNKPILWKVDWQGVKTIKKHFPNAIAIFISPSSYHVLEERLIKRGRESLTEINKRKQFTKEWLKHKDVYDHVVINYQGKFEETVKKATKIIKSHLS